MGDKFNTALLRQLWPFTGTYLLDFTITHVHSPSSGHLALDDVNESNASEDSKVIIWMDQYL